MAALRLVSIASTLLAVVLALRFLRGRPDAVAPACDRICHAAVVLRARRNEPSRGLALASRRA
ncbi:MAG: hypothetical protein MZU84_04075 [Sphingobacterium sp.]|nr:hypothetical protein [Sphingobacterium sp.]